MLIFLMPTLRRRDKFCRTVIKQNSQASGFTLLELIFSLAIIGIMLALGIGILSPSRSAIEDTCKRISALLSSARVQAMLSRHKVIVEFNGDQVFQTSSEGKKSILERLPTGISINIDNKPLMTGSKERFIFSPQGYTRERLIQLSDALHVWSIYLPSIGAPFFLRGRQSLEDMRKEYP